MTSVPVTTRPRRSITVSVVAWLGLFSGFATVVVSGAVLASHFTLTFLGTLVGGVVATVVSWALGRRQEWARQSVLGVQVLGIGGVLFRIMFPSLLTRNMQFPSNFPEEAKAQAIAQMRGVLLVQLVVVGLFTGFVIYKLTSKKVREEFAHE